jgi:hypothetical protein
MVVEEFETNTTLGNRGKADFRHKYKHRMTSGSFTTSEPLLHAKIHL